jgi:hypothetical protein
MKKGESLGNHNEVLLYSIHYCWSCSWSEIVSLLGIRNEMSIIKLSHPRPTQFRPSFSQPKNTFIFSPFIIVCDPFF